MKKLLNKIQTFLIETESNPYTIAILIFVWIVVVNLLIDAWEVYNL